MFELALFCFHFAGGAGRSYDGLKAGAPSWLKVRPLDLPAHGTRRGEPVLSSWDAVIEDALRQVRDSLSSGPSPFALLGHSMGGLVATEVAHAMSADGHAPVWLGIAGTERRPNRDDDPDWLTCSDARVIERLRELQATPPDLLESEALMQIVLPILRADLALCTTYAPPVRPPLSCPVMALGGKDDAETSERQLREWQEETQAAFEVAMVAGGHFFVIEAAQDVAAIVSEAIEGTATGSKRTAKGSR